MSPRKKKDPAQQAAAEAVIAFAGAQVAENPRGAPEPLPVNRVDEEAMSRYVSVEPNGERGTSDRDEMTGDVQGVVKNETAPHSGIARRATQLTCENIAQDTATSPNISENAPMRGDTPTSTKNEGSSSLSLAKPAEPSASRNTTETTQNRSTFGGSVGHVTSPSTVERDTTPPVTVVRPCALELAPDGAKCVVSRTDEGKSVRLLTPAGVETLDRGDLFYTLPPGAKIRKVGPTEYEAHRLGVQEGPLFTVRTARLAVERFLEVVA